MKLNKFLFYLLSFIWGFPMTIIGCIVGVVLLSLGYKPKKYGYCYYFEVGENWVGMNLGIIFLTSKSPSEQTMSHELGHAMQNCMYGVFMPLIIAIPSVTRYWYREYLIRSGKKAHSELPDYYSIWFESQASTLGTEFITWHKNNTK